MVTAASDAYADGSTTTRAIGSIDWTPSGASSRAVFISSSHKMIVGGGSQVTGTNVTVVIKVGSTTLKTITGVTNTMTANEGVFYQTSGTSQVTFSAEATYANSTGYPVYAYAALRVSETTGSA